MDQITLKLQSKEKTITATVLADILLNFQTTIFFIGEYLEGKPVKVSGSYGEQTRENFELIIKDLRKGSAEVTVGVRPPFQQMLYKEKEPLGEKALEMAYDLSSALTAEKYSVNTRNLIKDPANRKRILRVFKNIIPDSENYSIVFIGNSTPQELNTIHRRRIEEILPKIELPDSAKITGRLKELSLDGKRHFQVETASEIVSGIYSPDIEEFFKANLGNIVQLEGKFSKEKLLQISEKGNFRKLDKYPIISSQHGFEYSFETELQYQIDSDDYVLFEPTIRLLATGDSLKEAVSDAEEQISVLWSSYAEAKEGALTKDAMAFRNKLKKLIKKV